MSNNTSTTHLFYVTNISSPNIFISFLNIVLILIIITGNSFTIAAISKFRHLRYPSNILIGGLAMADLFFGSVHLPLQLVRTHLPWIVREKYPCLITSFISHFASSITITFLSSLSFERFYAIQFPFHYHSHASVKSYVLIITSVYTFIAVSLVPMFAGAGHWTEEIMCNSTIMFPSSYILVITVVLFTILILSALAFLRVCIAEFKFRRLDRQLGVSETRQRESVNTKCMLTAYTISMCLWMPHIFYKSYESVTKIERNVIFFRTILLLDLCSSAVNCFLYAWKNSKFRSAYRRLLGCNESRVDPGNSSTNQTQLYSS